MDRILCAGVYWHGVREGMMVVDINGSVKVTPFERECHSTVFYPGYVAIIDAGKFDEFVADDIEMMVSQGNIADKKKLDDYFKSSGLYYDESSPDRTLPLLIRLQA